MKIRFLTTTLLCGMASSLVAQGPPPPPPLRAGTSTTLSGTVSQLNYGPEGEVNGFVVDNGTLVMIPPFDSANSSSIPVGAKVKYRGYGHKAHSGRTVLEAEMLAVNGREIALEVGEPEELGRPPAPPRPPAPAAAGVTPPPPPPPPAGRAEEPPAPPPPPQN